MATANQFYVERGNGQNGGPAIPGFDSGVKGLSLNPAFGAGRDGSVSTNSPIEQGKQELHAKIDSLQNMVANLTLKLQPVTRQKNEKQINSAAEQGISASNMSQLEVDFIVLGGRIDFLQGCIDDLYNLITV